KGRLWATLVVGDHLATVLSVDHGRTWSRQEVPDSGRGAPAMTTIVVSRNGDHAWLLSFFEPPATNAGLPAVFPGVVPRKPFGVPSVWTMGPGGWRAVQVVGGPKAFGGAMADDDGTLWAAGDGAAGRVAVDGLWTAVLSPAGRVGWLTGLPDGTLVASAERSAGERWLRDGTGWVHVVVDAQH